MANVFSKVAADTLGISDIGRIIAPCDFDKVDGDDYIMHEDGEKIFFVIKSKADEYVFTNYALLHVDGESAMSKKRQVNRYDYIQYPIHDATLETAGNVDLDVELKWHFGDHVYSVDVDKKQLGELKDLYKALIEISRLQKIREAEYNDQLKALEWSNDTLANARLQLDDPTQALMGMTQYNATYLKEARREKMQRDFSSVFEKYINN